MVSCQKQNLLYDFFGWSIEVVEPALRLVGDFLYCCGLLDFGNLFYPAIFAETSSCWIFSEPLVRIIVCFWLEGASRFDFTSV